MLHCRNSPWIREESCSSRPKYCRLHLKKHTSRSFKCWYTRGHPSHLQSSVECSSNHQIVTNANPFSIDSGYRLLVPSESPHTRTTWIISVYCTGIPNDLINNCMALREIYEAPICPCQQCRHHQLLSHQPNSPINSTPWLRYSEAGLLNPRAYNFVARLWQKSFESFCWAFIIILVVDDNTVTIEWIDIAALFPCNMVLVP